MTAEILQLCMRWDALASICKRSVQMSRLQFCLSTELLVLWCRAMSRRNWDPSDYPQMLDDFQSPFYDSLGGSGPAVRRNAIMTWNSDLEVFQCWNWGANYEVVMWNNRHTNFGYCKQLLEKHNLGTHQQYSTFTYMPATQPAKSLRFKFNILFKASTISSSHEDFVLSCCKELADAACHRSKLRVTSRGHVACLVPVCECIDEKWRVDSRFF